MPKRKPSKPTPAPPTDLARARAESAELLGLCPNKLTPAGALKCDLIGALRSVVDDEIGKVDRANAADLGRLIVAVEALTKFLKESPADQRAEDDDGDDPHENLMRIIEGWIEADKAEKAEQAAELAAERAAAGLSAPVTDLAEAQSRIDELEARLVEFQPASSPQLPAPAPETKADHVIDPPTGDIFGPREFADSDPGPRPGPDDHKVRRQPTIIDGKLAPADSKVPPGQWGTVSSEEAERRRQAVNARPLAPPAPRPVQQQYPHGQEPWRGYVGGGNEGFFFGGDRGREW